MKVWVNGRIADAKGAIDANDRGVTLGDGIFETLAIVDGAPRRFDRHMARLNNGAAVLGIELSVDKETLIGAVKNICTAEGVTEGSARVTLLRGPAPRGVLPPATAEPTLMISAAAGMVGNAAPVEAIIATTTRRNERSPLAQVKSTNYLDAVIAVREASDAGAGDAILLNTRDMVAEATAANVFCRFGEELVTPPVSDGALPGIMRACVMNANTVIERSISADEFRGADEVFLTSSLSIRPVVRIDGKIIGDGCAGPAAARLEDLPRRAV